MTDLRCKLRKKDHKVLPLWDFGWFDLVTYEFAGPIAGNTAYHELFRALLQHPDYQQGFTGQADSDDWKGVHGPFQVEKLQPENFVRLTRKEFLDLVREDLEDDRFDSPPVNEQQVALYSLLADVTTDETVYFHLDIKRDDREYAHDLWWILYLFHEYILVDESTGLLHRCVVGYD
jgi:hypothetical protein